MLKRTRLSHIVVSILLSGFVMEAMATCSSTIANPVGTTTSPLTSNANNQCIENAGTVIDTNYALVGRWQDTNTTIVNSGLLQALYAIDLGNNGSITNTSSGVIELPSGYAGVGISTGTASGVPILNEGLITGTHSGSEGMDISGAGHSITNTGTIRLTGSDSKGIAIWSSSYSITSIVNTGTISVGSGTSSAGIYNTGTIQFLANLQGSGNAAGALTYRGNLPTTYNIVLGSNASTYGKLSYLGGGSSTTLANFGIYNGTINANTYTSVLSGVTSVTAGTTGTYSGQNYVLQLHSGSTTLWDLLFPNYVVGPDAANTLTSIQMNAGGLASIYNQQAAAYNAALSYDCSVYDENDLCVSAGGRYSYASPSATNAQAGLVIVGYRPVSTFRIGAFADQSVNISTANGFKQSYNSPMWGMFARWNMNKDGNGLQVQASAVNSASKLTVTRSQLTNTEAGSGNTQFDGQGYQLSTSYTQPVTDATSVVPYLGLRYTRINAGAYTENTTADVTSPLSYNAMAQNNYSAIAGVGVKSLLAEKLTGTASVGIQQSLKYSMANYQGASAISGLENFSVQMPGANNSMATATAGLSYAVAKNERVGLNVLWQQQPFINTNTTTALATYTIGF